jgi:hypothetical protein
MSTSEFLSVIPTVIESSGRGERAFDIYSLLLRKRIVFLGMPIDDQVANLIIAQLLYLSRGRPRPRDPDVHQLTWRSDLRRSCHLRHHADDSPIASTLWRLASLPRSARFY